MNTIKYIFTHPLGWGLAVIHWIVVAFAYLGDRPSEPMGFGIHNSTELMVILVLSDFPSLMLVKLLSGLIDPSTPITVPGLIFLVVLITFQWLLIGAGLAKIYREHHRVVPADDSSLKFH